MDVIDDLVYEGVFVFVLDIVVEVLIFDICYKLGKIFINIDYYRNDLNINFDLFYYRLDLILCS